ncbi:uncharacterized protein B0I36DRAFT_334809 [Microdochium trichocladiopsis]|uniref:Uncharacterized protein n=1 Tax=Microdochium trichocladiopsis TaxID=1682393 RepID=A0A9P9BKT3_9PEZI|nr:uncharacterized protein B0I36DRAFT_334809 [Microdochium trichocladiopsis]KAH7021584.1 hypothetical protein B0I36DRAFT_334809 [Microdochium trichocladiopsis]
MHNETRSSTEIITTAPYCNTFPPCPSASGLPFAAQVPFSLTPWLQDCPNIRHSQVQELSRLGSGVALCSYHADQTLPDGFCRVAFKFEPLADFRRQGRAWNGATSTPQPRVSRPHRRRGRRVPYRRLHHEIRPRWHDEQNTTRPFQLEWLRQRHRLLSRGAQQIIMARAAHCGGLPRGISGRSIEDKRDVLL